MPYCEACGAEVSSTSKFCRNCGAPQRVSPATVQPLPAAPASPTVQPAVTAPSPPPAVQPPPQPSQPATTYTPPPPPPPPVQGSVYAQSPASSGERVLGVLVLRKQKSLGRYDSYTGVVTNHRMIFAQLTGDMMKQVATSARDQAKAEGKGFWGQWGDQLKTSFNYGQKYYSMQPSAILAETPGNFAFDNSTISEIKLKEERDNDRGMHVYEMKVEIHHSSGKYEIRMDQDSNFINLLKQVYGQRVKTPFGFSSHGVNIRLGF